MVEGTPWWATSPAVPWLHRAESQTEHHQVALPQALLVFTYIHSLSWPIFAVQKGGVPLFHMNLPHLGLTILHKEKSCCTSTIHMPTPTFFQSTWLLFWFFSHFHHLMKRSTNYALMKDKEIFLKNFGILWVLYRGSSGKLSPGNGPLHDKWSQTTISLSLHSQICPK